MLLKPRSIINVGIVQFGLAAAFVIWLLFFPDTGGNFAWPVVPRLTAMFIGTSFILRAFLGYHLWREKYWYRLRWIVWGNFAFLTVIFLATFWHIGEMNWGSNIWVAHIWVIAYIVEPLILPFVEPHGEAAEAPLPPDLQEGPVSPGLRGIFVAVVIVGTTIAGLLFINPEFMDSRWPWPLDPFDARIMAAWPAACALWAATMYFQKDWAEIKMGVQSLVVYSGSLFVVWAITFGQYDPARHNRWAYGLLTGAFSLVLVYFYRRHEQARGRSSA